MITEKVLGQDIGLGPAEFYAAKVRPTEDIAQLRKKFMDIDNETVELTVESLEGSAENNLLWFQKGRNQHLVK